MTDLAAAVSAGRWSSNPDFSFWDAPLIELNGLTIGILPGGNPDDANEYIEHGLVWELVRYTVKLLDPKVAFLPQERNKLTHVSPHALFPTAPDFLRVALFNGFACVQRIKGLVEFVGKFLSVALSMCTKKISNPIPGKGKRLVGEPDLIQKTGISHLVATRNVKVRL